MRLHKWYLVCQRREGYYLHLGNMWPEKARKKTADLNQSKERRNSAAKDCGYFYLCGYK